MLLENGPLSTVSISYKLLQLIWGQSPLQLLVVAAGKWQHVITQQMTAGARGECNSPYFITSCEKRFLRI